MQTVSQHGKTLILGGAALFLGIVFTTLFYEQEIGLNFSLFAICVVACGILLANMFSRPMKRGEYVPIILALFFSSMVFVRSSEMLTFFNVLGSFLLLLIAISTYTGKNITTYLFGDYAKIPFLPFRFIGPFFETFLEIVSLSSLGGDHSRRKEIIRGSLMAFVVVIIFAWLFASADAVFEKILSNIFGFELDQEILNRVILGAIATAFFIGAFGFMFKKLHAGSAPLPTPAPRNLGALETMILLGSINVLFLTFIFLQLAHLFGGQSHLLTEGLTYAEYARKGFFELVLVAIFSYVIISFTEKQIIKKDESHLRSFKILSGILVVQIVLILISAFTRLSLYEDAYGFTDSRLFGHAFMIWIGVVLVLLAHHISTNGERAAFTLRTGYTIVILLFTMNMLNPDVFVAKKNLERYAATGSLDANYLGNLSYDALSSTIHLLSDPNPEISKSYARGLYWRNYYSSGEGSTWQSTRLNSAKAKQLVAPHLTTLEANKNWQTGTENSISIE
jgi:hypothetical protein